MSRGLGKNISCEGEGWMKEWFSQSLHAECCGLNLYLLMYIASNPVYLMVDSAYSGRCFGGGPVVTTLYIVGLAEQGSKRFSSQ